MSNQRFYLKQFSIAGNNGNAVTGINFRKAGQNNAFGVERRIANEWLPSLPVGWVWYETKSGISARLASGEERAMTNRAACEVANRLLCDLNFGG